MTRRSACPRPLSAVLKRQAFYQHPWAPTVESIINANFDAVVTTISYYTMPLSEAARKFKGPVVARVFGREHPRRYSEMPPRTRRPTLMAELSALADRFVFAQSYDNLAEVEDEPMRSRGYTVTVPLAPAIYESAGIWLGDGREALFLCPAINDNGYYAGIYAGIKRVFGDLPHQIFGRQFGEITDPAVLPYLSDADAERSLCARARLRVPIRGTAARSLLPARGHGHRDTGRLPARARCSTGSPETACPARVPEMWSCTPWRSACWAVIARWPSGSGRRKRGSSKPFRTIVRAVSGRRCLLQHRLRGADPGGALAPLGGEAASVEDGTLLLCRG